MAHVQKPDLVFQRNGRVHLNQQGPVQSTTGSRGVHISGSNAGYTMFWGREQDHWLPTPLECFLFTSPTVRHHVPSGFNWALLTLLVSVKGLGFWDVSSQCGEYSNYGHRGYARKQALPFKRNILPPPAASTVKLKGACSSKKLIPIYKTPRQHILVAHSLAIVLLVEVIRITISAMIKEFSCITASYQCPSNNIPRQEKWKLFQWMSCCHQDVRKTKAKWDANCQGQYECLPHCWPEQPWNNKIKV